MRDAKKVPSIPNSEEKIHGVRVAVSNDNNLVQLYFGGEPSEDIIEQLKTNGFTMATSIDVWQRELSLNAIAIAKNIIYVNFSM